MGQIYNMKIKETGIDTHCSECVSEIEEEMYLKREKLIEEAEQRDRDGEI